MNRKEEKMKEVPLIRSVVLSRYPSVNACISTRKGGVSPEPLGMNLSFSVGDEEANVRENRTRFFAAAGIPDSALVTQQQVHGERIEYVTTPGRVLSCDVLMTDVRGLFLAVSIADCVPILLYDAESNAVAAVHSGWRGSRLSLVSKVVAAMNRKFGTRPAHIAAFIGPAASVCCYEVGEEVAALFHPRYVQRSGSAKPHLDLKQVNLDFLLAAGVRPDMIEVSADCTICRQDLFHSYRREKERSGRMLGIVGLRP